MLEVLIRGIAVGGFILVALGVLAGGRTPARVTGALFSLAAAAHTLTQSRAAFVELGAAEAPVWIFSVVAAGFFWAFATELFGDNRRLAPWRFLPAAGLLAVGGAASIAPPEVARLLWLLQNLMPASDAVPELQTGAIDVRKIERDADLVGTGGGVVGVEDETTGCARRKPRADAPLRFRAFGFPPTSDMMECA